MYILRLDLCLPNLRGSLRSACDTAKWKQYCQSLSESAADIRFLAARILQAADGEAVPVPVDGSCEGFLVLDGFHEAQLLEHGLLDF